LTQLTAGIFELSREELHGFFKRLQMRLSLLSVSPLRSCIPRSRLIIVIHIDRLCIPMHVRLLLGVSMGSTSTMVPPGTAWPSDVHLVMVIVVAVLTVRVFARQVMSV